MPAAALIDAGAMLATIDAADQWHSACVEALSAVRLPLLTTEAVLTELFHLIRQNHLDKAWDFVRSGALTICPMTDSDLPALRALMEQYADRPMDFADATLVHLGAREGINTILTIDRDDFSTYRLPGRKEFTIVPDSWR